MNKIVVSALSLAFVAGLGSAELIVNGSFDQTLDIGWTMDTLVIAGLHRFERSDTLGSPGGYAARVYKELADHAALVQTVTVPGPDLDFTVDARLWVIGGSSTCWPVAAVIIRYLDNGGIELGNTKFYSHNEFALWVSSDTAHLIDVSALSGWQHYQLSIRQELADNLPGVNADQLKQIRVELYSYDSGT